MERTTTADKAVENKAPPFIFVAFFSLSSENARSSSPWSWFLILVMRFFPPFADDDAFDDALMVMMVLSLSLSLPIQKPLVFFPPLPLKKEEEEEEELLVVVAFLKQQRASFVRVVIIEEDVNITIVILFICKT